MWAIQSEIGSVRYFWIPNVGNAYAIGDNGSVWSRYKRCWGGWLISDDWTELSPRLDSDGYFMICLYFNKIKRERMVHKLVCEAVRGPCPPGKEACHNDGNRVNNNWKNLRYDTPVGNEADKIIHGTDNRGERSHSAKLNWIKVREIRAKYSSRESTITSLALEYGITYHTIWCVVNRLTWIEELS